MEFLHQLFTELPVAEKIAALQLIISSGGLLLNTVGLGCIIGGLVQMGKAGKRRNKEIDELGEGLKQQAKQAQKSTELLGQALERQGQALERQGQAMTQALTQQGQAMTQAFTQQGEVLAELLRRTA